MKEAKKGLKNIDKELFLYKIRNKLKVKMMIKILIER